MTELIVRSDAAEVAEEAAGLVLEAGAADIARAGHFDLCLAGGSTPRAVHAELVARRAALDWGAVDFYFGDERAVGPDDAASNYRMARETLFAPLSIAPERIHRMAGDLRELDAAAADYETTLRAGLTATAGDGVPAFDLMILGLGADAHTASLFPRTAALWERRRLVVANAAPETGPARLTATLPLINAARRLLFVVVGSAKAAALARVLEAEHDVSLWPAQGVDPAPGQLTWLMDEAAAALLQRKR